MGEYRATFIIGAVGIVIVGLIAGWALLSGDDAVSSETLTEISDPAEARRHVEVSHSSIATSENYFGHRIRVISANLTNVSEVPLRVVEVRLTFSDYDGNPVFEHVDTGFRNLQKPLNPGEIYRYTANFENLPREWNYRVPDIEITKVAY